MSLSIIFEDDALLVVDKPSGLIVHRGMARDDVTMVDLVRDYLDAPARPAHRLDRQTSGVLLFAKSSEAAAALRDAFDAGAVDKTYLALVRGVPKTAGGHIDHPIPRSEGGERVEAQTDWELIESAATEPRHVSLVRAHPRTGRFHQVRRHLKHIDHPILGDANYGKGKLNRAFREKYGLERLALHAAELVCVHPRTGESCNFTASVPADLAEPLSRMGLEVA